VLDKLNEPVGVLFAPAFMLTLSGGVLPATGLVLGLRRSCSPGAGVRGRPISLTGCGGTRLC
jgi:hypothetical protein